jgi:hypothetical protein
LSHLVLKSTPSGDGVLYSDGSPKAQVKHFTLLVVALQRTPKSSSWS